MRAGGEAEASLRQVDGFDAKRFRDRRFLLVPREDPAEVQREEADGFLLLRGNWCGDRETEKKAGRGTTHAP